jgi:PAS domain S-box-containing protein
LEIGGTMAMATKEPNILIIEDSERICETLSDILSENGYEVKVANQGKEGLALAKEEKIPICLVDLRLPDINGIEVLRGIKEDNPEAYTIIITAYASKENAIEALKIGVHSYLEKPLNIEELLEAVKKASEGYMLREEKNRAEEELEKSEEKYRVTFEHTGTAMCIIEEDATISLVNKEFEKLSGYSREEIEEKKSWTDFIVGMKEYHEERGKEGKEVPAKYEFRAVDKGGNIKTIYLNMGLIPGTKKSVASFIDITGRRQKEILEAQSELRTILTDTIPVLLMGAPPEKENMFIHQMCSSIEEVLWEKHLVGVKEVDMKTLGSVLCKIMNDLGGDFRIESVDDRKCVVKGNACPWGTQAQRNQVLCMLTRGIFSRLAAKVFEDVAVNLDKTIGNGDEYCSIQIQVYGKT